MIPRNATHGCRCTRTAHLENAPSSLGEWSNAPANRRSPGTLASIPCPATCLVDSTSSAGTNVVATTTAIVTTVTAPAPTERMMVMSMSISPATAIATVTPLKMTVRPAVAIVIAMARSRTDCGTSRCPPGAARSCRSCICSR